VAERLERVRACGTVGAMPAVLCISSHVVRGHVGASAAAPALAALRIEAWALPTIVLSSHPAHGATARHLLPAGDLEAMAAMLEEHGWLGQCDAVLTGYFAEPEQVAVAMDIVNRLKRARPVILHCCDPILGDDPGGLYVPGPVADAVRDRLVPLADIVKPNRFELEWLGGRPVAGLDEALAAARRLGPPEALVTSIPADEEIANALLWPDGAAFAARPRREGVPKGTGDLMSALYLGHRLNGEAPERAFARALAGLDHVLDLSEGRDELALAQGLAGLAAAKPVKVRRHE